MMIYEGVFNFVEGNKSRAGYDPHDVLVCCRFYLMMLYFSFFSIGAANVRDWSSLIIVMDGQKGPPLRHSGMSRMRSAEASRVGRVRKTDVARSTSREMGIHDPAMMGKSIKQ